MEQSAKMHVRTGALTGELGLPPPPGVTPNVENPDRTLQSWNIVTQSLCISLTTMIFVPRMYCRIYIQRTIGREDWMSLAAWLGGIGYNVTALLMGRYGGGLHQWDLPNESVESVNKTTYATMALYGPTAFVTKAAILLLLARLFQPFRKLVIFIYVFFSMLAAYYIPVIFVKIFICVPVTRFWDRDIDGTCLNQQAVILADASISAASDLTILILPLIGTSSLQMPRKKKMRVIGMLGAGGAACASGIVRLVLVLTEGNSPDTTYTFMRINLWGNAEVSIGIICACLPFLAPLAKKAHREVSIKPSSKRGYRMDSMQRYSGQETPDIRSQNGSIKAASDENILISHAQAHGNIETTIHAESTDISHEQQQQQQQQQQQDGHENHGIMKTVDVRHTISTC